MKQPNGYVLWRGPSPVDGAPIVCVITRSTNRKTGPSWQTWIMRDDIHPNEALKNGGDHSVCGNCIHRPRVVDVPSYTVGKKRKNVIKAARKRIRTCYVGSYVIASVWKAYKKGHYPKITVGRLVMHILEHSAFVRLGAYGDPALVPYEINSHLVRFNAHAGYTHQWDEPWFDKRYLNILMCSTDTEEQLAKVRAMGARAFHVTGGALPQGVGQCPAAEPYKEKTGKIITCAACRKCNGLATQANSMGIQAHGNGKNYIALKLVEVSK